MKNAVVYDMVGPYVEPCDYDSNLTQLNKMFEGAVDVIGLRPATDGQIGCGAWVRDDAVATGNAGAYRIQFADEYFDMSFLPQSVKGSVVLGVDEEGNTFGLTPKRTLEVQSNLSVALCRRPTMTKSE